MSYAKLYLTKIPLAQWLIITNQRIIYYYYLYRSKHVNLIKALSGEPFNETVELKIFNANVSEMGNYK